MAIEVEQQKVQVSDTAPTVDVNPGNNAGAITISGKELEALPDDPDELLTDLQALAGLPAGPNGGQLYIDGFTAGELPRGRLSARSGSIRIRSRRNTTSSATAASRSSPNPAPISFTASFFSMETLLPLIHRIPSVPSTAPSYDSILFNASIGGAINKKSSFFVSAQRRDINNLSAINAIDPTTFLPFSSTLPNPHDRTNIGPRLDYALSKNNTLTVRYQYYRDTETNPDLTQFDLATQQYQTGSTEHTVQISDTQVFGSKVVNETRFPILEGERYPEHGVAVNPAVNVQQQISSVGATTGGTQTDHQDHYEFQNYTSVISWQSHHQVWSVVCATCATPTSRRRVSTVLLRSRRYVPCKQIRRIPLV